MTGFRGCQVVITAMTTALLIAAAWLIRRSWPQPESRWWAISWSIMALFGLLEMWLWQMEYLRADGWQTAYWRDIHPEHQKQCLQVRSRLKYAHPSAGDVAEFRSLGAVCAQPPPQALFPPLRQKAHALFSKNNRNTAALSLSISSEEVRLWSLPILTKIHWNQPCGPIPADPLSNFNNESEATPVRRCCLRLEAPQHLDVRLGYGRLFGQLRQDSQGEIVSVAALVAGLQNVAPAVIVAPSGRLSNVPAIGVAPVLLIKV